MTIQRPVIIVTGSSGLLGRPTTERLAGLGCEVFAFDRPGLPGPFADATHAHGVECDLTDYNSVCEAVGDVYRSCGKRLASVVHLAAYYDFSGEDSPLYQKVTIEGTNRLLNVLSGFEIEQFLFSSTMLIHKPAEVGSYIDENSPLVAKWPYPKSKIETERLIREEHAHVRSVFLRLAGVYTDWGKQPTLVQQINRIYEQDFESHFFPGDQTSGQSSVYLDDAVDAIVRTVERRSMIDPQTAILIGEPDPPSYAELQDLIGHAIYGRNWTTVYIPPVLAQAGAAVIDALQGGEAFIKPFMVSMADDHYALDIHRAKELLDWSPEHKLTDVLPSIIENLLTNPIKWYHENGLGTPQMAQKT